MHWYDYKVLDERHLRKSLKMYVYCSFIIIIFLLRQIGQSCTILKHQKQ